VGSELLTSWCVGWLIVSDEQYTKKGFKMNIYVGNLSYDVAEQDLNELFEEFGAVQSAKIITDRDTGRSKGFAFVEMEDDASGDHAIEELNGVEISGRNITVNKARPREERPRRRDW
jgi:RNA recognition motif-containing protein